MREMVVELGLRRCGEDGGGDGGEQGGEGGGAGAGLQRQIRRAPHSLVVKPPPLLACVSDNSNELISQLVSALDSDNIDENKEEIAYSGAIQPLVSALKADTSTARENAVCALLRLSQIDLMSDLGIVKPLVELMSDLGWNMVDKSAFVLSLLMSVPEARAALDDEVGDDLKGGGGGLERCSRRRTKEMREREKERERGVRRVSWIERGRFSYMFCPRRISGSQLNFNFAGIIHGKI